VLSSTISFIYYFILFYAANPPSLESVLFVVKDRLEGLKNNIGFWKRGGGRQEGRG